MGFMRKALFVATGGLSGLVFKDESNKKRTANATKAKKTVRAKKQTKVTVAKSQPARRSKAPTARAAKPQASSRPKPQAARRPKPQAAHRPAPQAARASTAAQAPGALSGTSSELERLANLHARGVLTREEFAAAKAKILGTSLISNSPDRAPTTYPSVEANIAAARHLADLGVRDGTASIASTGGD
jgi:hypothetical protein